MDDEAAMINRIAAILGSKAVLKIDFRMDFTRVTGAALYIVVNYLTSRRLGLAGIKIKFGGIGGNAAAEYRPHENVLKLKRDSYGQSDFERMTIVHECVHA